MIRRILPAFALALLGAALAAEGQESSRRLPPPPDVATNLRMRDTAILGERQTPDIFFVIPTGRGGKLKRPHTRDYSFEIQEPVVKPWLERAESVGPLAARNPSTELPEWRRELERAPLAPPPLAVPPAPLGSLETIPAETLPPPPAGPSIPRVARSLPPEPPPAPRPYVPAPIPPPPGVLPPSSYAGGPPPAPPPPRAAGPPLAGSVSGGRTTPEGFPILAPK